MKTGVMLKNDPAQHIFTIKSFLSSKLIKLQVTDIK